MELSDTAVKLLGERLQAIEFALGLPQLDGAIEPTISERDFMEGKFDPFLGKHMKAILWVDCNGEPECLHTSREILSGCEELGTEPTGIPVYIGFECKHRQENAS